MSELKLFKDLMRVIQSTGSVSLLMKSGRIKTFTQNVTTPRGNIRLSNDSGDTLELPKGLSRIVGIQETLNLEVTSS